MAFSNPLQFYYKNPMGGMKFSAMDQGVGPFNLQTPVRTDLELIEANNELRQRALDQAEQAARTASIQARSNYEVQQRIEQYKAAKQAKKDQFAQAQAELKKQSDEIKKRRQQEQGEERMTKEAMKAVEKQYEAETGEKKRFSEIVSEQQAKQYMRRIQEAKQKDEDAKRAEAQRKEQEKALKELKEGLAPGPTPAGPTQRRAIKPADRLRKQIVEDRPGHYISVGPDDPRFTQARQPALPQESLRGPEYKDIPREEELRFRQQPYFPAAQETLEQEVNRKRVALGMKPYPPNRKAGLPITEQELLRDEEPRFVVTKERVSAEEQQIGDILKTEEAKERQFRDWMAAQGVTAKQEQDNPRLINAYRKRYYKEQERMRRQTPKPPAQQTAQDLAAGAAGVLPSEARVDLNEYRRKERLLRKAGLNTEADKVADDIRTIEFHRERQADESRVKKETQALVIESRKAIATAILKKDPSQTDLAQMVVNPATDVNSGPIADAIKQALTVEDIKNIQKKVFLAAAEDTLRGRQLKGTLNLPVDQQTQRTYDQLMRVYHNTIGPVAAQQPDYKVFDPKTKTTVSLPMRSVEELFQQAEALSGPDQRSQRIAILNAAAGQLLPGMNHLSNETKALLQQEGVLQRDAKGESLDLFLIPKFANPVERITQALNQLPAMNDGQRKQVLKELDETQNELRGQKRWETREEMVGTEAKPGWVAQQLIANGAKPKQAIERAQTLATAQIAFMGEFIKHAVKKVRPPTHPSETILDTSNAQSAGFIGGIMQATGLGLVAETTAEKGLVRDKKQVLDAYSGKNKNLGWWAGGITGAVADYLFPPLGFYALGATAVEGIPKGYKTYKEFKESAARE